MIGSVAGNYKIVDKIGEGGMGAVYKGIDMMLEREVAIKVLRPELARQPDIVERFRIEAVTLAKLNHPNIATLFNFFRQGDDYFMVMEFVRGETLDSRMRRSGTMAHEVAIPLFCQALDGIDHAHRMGIIHRDIKPANIMLTEAGSIKVMDFGIARVLGSARMTKQGNIIGTIEYMSPEQVLGQETDSRSDIYSLGILLYEMLTGRVPFTGDSDYKLMQCQIEVMPPPPRTFAPNIPTSVENAILRALAKNPNERFQAAADFRGALLGASWAAGAGGHGAQGSVLPFQTHVPPPGQLWPGPYGNQPANVATQGPIPYPNQNMAGGPGAWAGPVPGPQAKPEGNSAQATVDYWQSPMAGAASQPTTSARRGLTWKHFVGALVGICILVAIPLAIWAIVELMGPPTATAYIKRGDDLAAARKWSEAEAEYRHAAELQPSDGPIQFMLHIALLRQNKNNDASEQWQNIDQAALWPQVEAYYRKALSTQPGSADYHQYLSVALSGQKRDKEAEQAARDAIRIDPNYAPYHNTLGGVLSDQKDLSRAEAEYREAIRLDPKYFGPYLGLAGLLYNEKKYGAAEAEYREATRIDPRFATAHSDLASSLYAQKKYPQAEAEYRVSIQLDPKNARLHSGLGSALSAQEKYAESGAEYREAIQLNPKAPELHSGLGLSLYAQKHYSEAEAEYRQAVQLDPQNSDWHYSLGLCMNDEQKYAEAEGEYRESIRLDPSNSFAHNNLGVSLERENKYQEAEAEYREAIRLDPSNAVAQRNLDRVAAEHPLFGQF
jgi:tetratricopeptide (TPR) repeat protein/tRNA A-37 threonylcarbamoyl transferase component Bud32